MSFTWAAMRVIAAFEFADVLRHAAGDPGDHFLAERSARRDATGARRISHRVA